MGLYRQLATIDRLLESTKHVEADNLTTAHNHATNIKIAAAELVRAAKRGDAHYANADCALHAKNLADNLNLYLQHHAQKKKIALPNLKHNTEGLLTSRGTSAAQRFEETHEHEGAITWVRNRCAHGEYSATPKNKAWRIGVATEYLCMAQDCLSAVHEIPSRGVTFGAVRSYARLNGTKLSTVGAMLGTVGVLALLGASSSETKRLARERELRNEVFLQYAPDAHAVADRTPMEPIRIVNEIRPGQMDFAAATDYAITKAAIDGCELDYLCPRTRYDFDKWLENVRYEPFATHACLEFWTRKSARCDTTMILR